MHRWPVADYNERNDGDPVRPINVVHQYRHLLRCGFVATLPSAYLSPHCHWEAILVYSV